MGCRPAPGRIERMFSGLSSSPAAIPDDWVIYVKENSYQFVNFSHGHLGRIIKHYSDALLIPKVVFVSTDVSSFELCENTGAVATITGTVGLESMVRGKPVIVFGLSWIEDFDGVLRIRNNQDVDKIMQFIESYHFDQHKLDCYLLTSYN